MVPFAANARLAVVAVATVLLITSLAACGGTEAPRFTFGVPTAGPTAPATRPAATPTAAPVVVVQTPGSASAPTGLQRADWVGIWRGREPDFFGVSDVETVFLEGGTFTNLHTNAAAGAMLRIWGQWDIFTITDRPTLRFAVEGFDPKEWCGPQSCTSIQIPTGASQYFRFTDANTVVLTAPGCTGASCAITYRRDH